jgi:hypothetical protein
MTDQLDNMTSPEPEGINEFGYREEDEEGQSVELNQNPRENVEPTDLDDSPANNNPRTSVATAAANLVTTSTGRTPRGRGLNISMGSIHTRRSLISQISILSTAASIFTWILNQFHTFTKICNGTIGIPVSLLHILKVIGIDTNFQAKKVIRNLALTSISDILLVEHNEWIDACVTAGINHQ